MVDKLEPELRDFASLMVDEVIAKVRLQLDAGQSLTVADQRLMLEQLITERKRLSAATPANGEQVERVAKAMYDAIHAGLRNCYAWEDAWEDHQEHHRDRYYKEARAAIAAMNPASTEDARSRVKVLEEAARLLRDIATCFRAGHIVPETMESVYLLEEADQRARTALGNKETDRHG